MQRPTLALTRRLPLEVEMRAAALYATRPNAADMPWSASDWAGCVADGVVCTVTDRIDAAAIATMSPRVRLLANFGVGVSHIDLEAARHRGIVVTNTPDVLTDATADIAILLMLGAARRASEGEAMMRARTWQGWAPTAMLGTHLGGKTLGIYGMGRIGMATAMRATAFGMRIVYHGRSVRRDLPFDAEYIAEAARFWPRCDVLSLHAPLTEATRNLIGPRVIAQLPVGAIVVNTARGELVDDDALIAALQGGRIAAAGLDVFTGEPQFDARYAALTNIFLLPHLGSATRETRIAMGMRALDNVDAFFAGGAPPDRVA